MWCLVAAGWLRTRPTRSNCEYPQELVLQLVDGPCRLTQVQLLSHQTHIATKIELFLSKDAELEEAQFTRLGCVWTAFHSDF